MKKNNMDKIIAKVIYYFMNITVIFAVVFAFSAVGAMVEAMAVTKAQFIVFTVCVSWVGIYSAFIYFLNKR